LNALAEAVEAPDPEAIERAAGALGVAEAFVEKDWHVTLILRSLASFEHDGCTR
jgi:hypothetical protein